MATSTESSSFDLLPAPEPSTPGKSVKSRTVLSVRRATPARRELFPSDSSEADSTINLAQLERTTSTPRATRASKAKARDLLPDVSALTPAKAILAEATRVQDAATPVKPATASRAKSVGTPAKALEAEHAAPGAASPTKAPSTPAKAATEPASSPVKAAAPLSDMDKSLRNLYRVIQQATGAVGGYGDDAPIYGEITMGTFQKVVDSLCEHTGFGADSAFIDIGSGLGKPNLHVALSPGVRLSYGVELGKLRWQLSMHNLRFVLKQVPEVRQSVVYFACADATDMGHFEPFTHVYMFDVGFPPAVLVSLANSFNVSKTVQALVSFTRPEKVISVYGFNVELITQITTRMNGSTETHTAYIYRTKNFGEKTARPRRQLQLDKSFLVPATGKSANKHTDKPSQKTSDDTTKKNKEKGKSAKENKEPATAVTELRGEEYTQWMQTAGLLGAPGQRHVRERNPPRKLF